MKIEKSCSVCGVRIPAGRVEAVPDSDRCVGCVEVRPRSIQDVEIDEPSNEDMVRAVMTPDREGR